jgi:hypothetical protein
MVRPARRRSGPSYEEVKALIDEKEALKAPKILSRKQREQEERRRKRLGERPTDDNSNRIRGILQRLIGTEDPEDLMLEIMDALDVSGFIPDPGKYYTFVYNAKTPGIQYDQHPLVAVTNVAMKGFSGFNYHWAKMRNYTWNEVAGQLYEVDPGELADLREIPYAKFLNT